jgi:Iap family predicted aminopeptidase
MGVVPFGGSDAMSLSKAGIPSITVIGMDTKKHDFTYHTRHDIPDNIEPLALEHLRDVMLDFVHKWDTK